MSLILQVHINVFWVFSSRLLRLHQNINQSVDRFITIQDDKMRVVLSANLISFTN